MDVAAVAVQQVALQSKASIAAVKSAAKAEQAIVELVQQAATRGQNLNIVV